jgi:hypothetical protein
MWVSLTSTEQMKMKSKAAPTTKNMVLEEFENGAMMEGIRWNFR